MSFQVLLITSAECTNCFWHFFPKLFSPGLFAEAMKLFLMAIIYGCFCCVTANRCRPYLVTPVEDYNNYINAVFLNVSFSRAPAYRFLALKSFWSCCRYVIEWFFFYSLSHILSLYLSGALIPGLSEERCLHRYSDAPAKHRCRFLENDLWPEFLLHCYVEWNRGDRWSTLFIPFSK